MKCACLLIVPLVAGALIWQRPDGDPPQPPRGRPEPRDQDGRRGQEPPDMRRGGGMERGPGPAVMTATDKYLFILRGDTLLQYDVKDLSLVKQVKLPPPDGMGGPPDEGGRPPRPEREKN